MPFTYPFTKTDEDENFGPPVVPGTPTTLPDPTTTPPTTPETPTTTTPNSSSLMNLLSPLFTSLTDNPNGLSGGMLAAYLAQAYNHYKDSDRYMTTADKYLGNLDPFGSQRTKYQDSLSSLMTDPEGYLKNDPFYQGQMRLVLGPAGQMLRSKGYGNSGNILTELTKLSGDVTSKYIGDLRKDLGHFAGADITPSAAASLLNTAMTGSINSRNQALGDIGNLLTQLQRGNTTTTPPGGDPTTIDSWLNAFRSAGNKITPDLLRSALTLFRTPEGGLDIARMQEAGLSANDIINIVTNGNDTGADIPPPPTETDPGFNDPGLPPLYPGDGYGPPEPPLSEDYSILYNGDLYGGNGP